MSYISALVIQTTDSILINETTGEVGQTQQIATPNSGGQIDGDFWATPVTAFGVVGTGYNYNPTQPGSTDKPDAQSFHVFRLINQSQAGNVYVLGTSDDYNTVSKEVECCGTNSPAPVMPTVDDLPIIAACQVLCNTNTATPALYIGVFAAPLPDTGTYAANGYFNGTALPQVTGATVAALVTALNASGSWNSSAIGTWTNPSGSTLIVTQADGPGTDILCMKVTVA